MYSKHPPFIFVFDKDDYQANIWLDTNLFKDSINFIHSQMTELVYEVYPETLSFKIFDKIDNFIILNAKNHEMIVQLFKSTKIAIISGTTEDIKNQNKEKLHFTYASLK